MAPIVRFSASLNSNHECVDSLSRSRSFSLCSLSIKVNSCFMAAMIHSLNIFGLHIFGCSYKPHRRLWWITPNRMSALTVVSSYTVGLLLTRTDNKDLALCCIFMSDATVCSCAVSGLSNDCYRSLWRVDPFFVLLTCLRVPASHLFHFQTFRPDSCSKTVILEPNSALSSTFS